MTELFIQILMKSLPNCLFLLVISHLYTNWTYMELFKLSFLKFSKKKKNMKTEENFPHIYKYINWHVKILKWEKEHCFPFSLIKVKFIMRFFFYFSSKPFVFRPFYFLQKIKQIKSQLIFKLLNIRIISF